MGASFYVLFNRLGLPVTPLTSLPNNVSAVFGKETDSDEGMLKSIVDLPNVFVTPTIENYRSDILLPELLRLLRQVKTEYVLVGELSKGFFAPDCGDIIPRFKATGKRAVFAAHRRPFYTYGLTHSVPRYLYCVDTVKNRDLLGEDLFLLPMYSFGETAFMIDLFERIQRELEASLDIPEKYRYQVATRKVFDKDQGNVGIDNTHRVFSLLDEKELSIEHNGVIRAAWTGGTRGNRPAWVEFLERSKQS